METLSTESNLTTSKESIRKDIRHALSAKGVNRYPSLDLSDDFIKPSDDLIRDFVVKFRALGGKYVPCTKEQFASRLIKLLQGQNYPVLLNTKSQLAPLLQNNNISFVNVIDVNSPADAAIIYSDALITSTCSFVFSPHNSLYPSIKGLASDIIIIAFANDIVPDFKTALEQQQNRNGGELYDMNEIISPTPLTIHENQEIRTPLAPRYILMLVM